MRREIHLDYCAGCRLKRWLIRLVVLLLVGA
jgi:hypothetical protein